MKDVFRTCARCLVACGLLALAGCASNPPVQEMSDARQAIEAAREAQAEVYAPGSLHHAENYLDEATRGLESGSYAAAREAALAAKRAAMQARSEAVQAKEPR